MKSLNLALIAVALTALSACHAKVEDKKYSYELEVNGCNTGKHEFSSIEAYCDALKNDSLNNGCAESTRREYYARECSGSFDLGLEFQDHQTAERKDATECAKGIAAKIAGLESANRLEMGGETPTMTIREATGGFADGQHMRVAFEYSAAKKTITYHVNYYDYPAQTGAVCKLGSLSRVLPPEPPLLTPESCISRIEASLQAMLKVSDVFVKHFGEWDTTQTFGYKFKSEDGQGYSLSASRKNCEIQQINF